jgi:hypothetical protein
VELDDLRNVWRDYDAKLDKSMKLNMHLLKRFDLDKTQSELKRFLRAPILGVVIGFLVMLIMGNFAYTHMGEPEFLAPAILLFIFALGQVVFGIYQSSVVLHVSYDEPITAIQRKLAAMRVHRIRYLTITRFAYAILWIPVVTVGVEAAFGVNLFEYLDTTWLVLNLLIGVACVLFAFWLSQRWAAGKITSPFLIKLVDNVSLNDFTGKSLISAIAFLDDIVAFEREDD